MRARCFISFLCLFSVTAVAAGTPGDPELEEVVVTATLSGTPLASLPGSATVIGGDELAAAGLQHFADVLQLAPNVFFAGGTSRPRYFQIRGIGELEQYEGAPNPSVGFLIDDIDFSGIAMPAALFDVAQAEVLRGPQGTAWGANAIAGLVSLRSVAPRARRELQGEAEFGDYGTWSAGVVANDTLGDAGAWRIGVQRAVSDGYRRNAWLQRRDTNGFDENLVRARLALQPGAGLDVQLTALYADADNGYDAWSIDNTRVTQSDRPGVDAQRSRALALRIDWQGPGGLTLRSITTALRADMDYAFDGDWGNPVLWGANGPYDFYEDIERERRNLSQELRLIGRRADGSEWVLGAYALRLDEQYALLDLYNGDVYRELDSDYRALSLAAYGQYQRALTGRLSVSAGLRVERRDARYRDGNGLARDPVDTMAGGHLALTWQLAPTRSAYASLTRGYKAGGINPTAAAIPDDLRDFAPEFLWNLEAGLRAATADGRFESRTSLFYMRRTDQQVSSSVQPDPADPLTFVLLTDNAARGDNLGLESELAWRPLPSLKLGATVALLRARFRDYVLEGRDLSGRASPHAPDHQFGLSAEWRSARGWFAQAAWQAVDGYYFSASHDERAGAHQLTSLRAGYQAPRWSATAYVRNLFDARYAVRGFFFGNEPPDFTPRRYVQNGDPRTVGVRVSFGF